jgi:ELWxxDGT repeat protein
MPKHNRYPLQRTLSPPQRSNPRRGWPTLLVVAALLAPVAAAEEVRLVKDIAPGVYSAFDGDSGANYAAPAALGRILFFVADDDIHGRELWKSNGRAGGTVMVRDIWEGSEGSFPPRQSDPTWFRQTLTPFGGEIFFIASDGIHGYALWKSDGTEDGTVMVKDFGPSMWGPYPRNLTVAGAALYLTTSSFPDYALWKSDGTGDGTVLIREFSGSAPTELTDLGGVLFFAADDGSGDGHELWRSDGTAPGTAGVKDICPGANGSSLQELTVSDGRLLFSARHTPGSQDHELWKSDGTAVGTERVLDINSGGSGSWPAELTDFGGTLFFRATDGIRGRELWMSDGTGDGTELLTDINPGFADSWAREPTVVDGTLFFVADDGDHSGGASENNHSLWKTDGTEEGTLRVKDMRAGPNPVNNWPRHLTEVSGALFFRADDGVNGYELWTSNGSEAGTVMVEDVRSGALGSKPYWLTEVGRTLFFVAHDGTHGYELWTTPIFSDGFESGDTSGWSMTSPASGTAILGSDNRFIGGSNG